MSQNRHLHRPKPVGKLPPVKAPKQIKIVTLPDIEVFDQNWRATRPPAEPKKVIRPRLASEEKRRLKKQSAQLTCVCPHCQGAMTFAPEHRGMASQCPHCQQAITLGSAAIPNTPAAAVPESERRKGSLIWVAVAAGILAVAGMVVFYVKQSRENERASAAAIKKELADQALRDKEYWDSVAAADEKLRKIEAQYPFGSNPNYRKPEVAAASAPAVSVEEKNLTDLRRLVEQWKYQFTEEQKLTAATKISERSSSGLSSAQYYEFLERLSRAQ